jgi:hypothetical protein
MEYKMHQPVDEYLVQDVITNYQQRRREKEVN